MSLVTDNGSAVQGSRSFASDIAEPIPLPATVGLEYVAVSGGRYMQNVARLVPPPGTVQYSPYSAYGYGCVRGGGNGPISSQLSSPYAAGPDAAYLGPFAGRAAMGSAADIAGGAPAGLAAVAGYRVGPVAAPGAGDAAPGWRGPPQSEPFVARNGGMGTGVPTYDHPYTAELVRQSAYGMNVDSVGQFSVRYGAEMLARQQQAQLAAQAAQAAASRVQQQQQQQQQAQSGSAGSSAQQLAATGGGEVVSTSGGGATTTVTVGDRQGYAPTIVSGGAQAAGVAGLARVAGVSGPAPFAAVDPIAQVAPGAGSSSAGGGGGGDGGGGWGGGGRQYHYRPMPGPDGGFSYHPRIPFPVPAIWPQPPPVTTIGSVIMQDAIQARKHHGYLDPWDALACPFAGGPRTPMSYASPVDFGMARIGAAGCGGIRSRFI